MTRLKRPPGSPGASSRSLLELALALRDKEGEPIRLLGNVLVEGEWTNG